MKKLHVFRLSKTMASSVLKMGIDITDFAIGFGTKVSEFISKGKFPEAEPHKLIHVAGNYEVLKDNSPENGEERDPKSMKLVLNLQMNSSGSSNDDDTDENAVEKIPKDVLWFVPLFMRTIACTAILFMINGLKIAQNVMRYGQSWLSHGKAAKVFYDEDDHRKKISPRRRMKRSVFGILKMAYCNSGRQFSIESLHLQPSSALVFAANKEHSEKRKWRNYSEADSDYDPEDYDQCSDIIEKSPSNDKKIGKLDKMKTSENLAASDLETTEYILLKDTSMSANTTTTEDSEGSPEKENYLEIPEEYESAEDPDYEIPSGEVTDSESTVHSDGSEDLLQETSLLQEDCKKDVRELSKIDESPEPTDEITVKNIQEASMPTLMEHSTPENNGVEAKSEMNDTKDPAENTVTQNGSNSTDLSSPKDPNVEKTNNYTNSPSQNSNGGYHKGNKKKNKRGGGGGGYNQRY